MDPDTTRPPDHTLRRNAEDRLGTHADQPPTDVDPESPEAWRRTLRELRVHRVELEVQNEELRRAQAEIDAARARYFDLYDRAPVGYCTVSGAGLILEANVTATTLLGVAPHALVQQPLSRFVATEDQDRYYLFCRQLLETGEPQTRELRMARSDGTSLCAQVAGTVARPQGRAPECRLVLGDITEHKRVQEALRERVKELNCLYGIAALIEREDDLERVLQGSIDLMPNAWFHSDVACAQVVFEGRQHHTAGFRRTTWRQSADLTVEGESAGFLELCYLEERPIRDDGPFLKEERALIDAIAKRLGRMIERKRAEAALRRSEARYAVTLGALDDGLWDWHVPSGNAFFSPVYYTMLGYDDREFPATYGAWRHLVHPDDIERVERGLQESVESGTKFDIGLRMKMKSGAWLWVSTRGRVVEHDEKHRALRMVGTLSDITERKRADEALAALSRQNEAILTSAGEGILGLDLNGRTTFVSPSAAAMLGYEVGELVGAQSHATWHHTRPDGRPYSPEECPIQLAYLDGTIGRCSDEVFWR